MSSEGTAKLGLLAAVAVVLGNIVGVMVFLTPDIAAKHLPWDGWFLAAWAVGGALALLGALCLGELGAMMPEAGGDYVYIREAYGDRTAFLSGYPAEEMMRRAADVQPIGIFVKPLDYRQLEETLGSFFLSLAAEIC